MALVVFLRGVNVGGHRRFRPSLLAKKLRAYDVVSIGAAGTFIVRGRVSRAKLLAAVRRSLPFETSILICSGRDLIAIEARYAPRHARRDVTRFVSVAARKPSHPKRVALPSRKRWLVRVIGWHGRFMIGEYRRHMKTIGYLGQLDILWGAKVTTRNWNTIRTIASALRKR